MQKSVEFLKSDSMTHKQAETLRAARHRLLRSLTQHTHTHNTTHNTIHTQHNTTQHTHNTTHNTQHTQHNTHTTQHTHTHTQHNTHTTQHNTHTHTHNTTHHITQNYVTSINYIIRIIFVTYLIPSFKPFIFSYDFHLNRGSFES